MHFDLCNPSIDVLQRRPRARRHTYHKSISAYIVRSSIIYLLVATSVHYLYVNCLVFNKSTTSINIEYGRNRIFLIEFLKQVRFDKAWFAYGGIA